MFIINIIGGLGNQMFCYAFAQAIKHHYQTDIALHVGGFEDVKDNRGFELTNIFKIDDPIIENYREIAHLTNYSQSFSSKLKRKLFGLKETHITEKMHRFDPYMLHLPIKKAIFIEGLWQDEYYFRDIEDCIRQKFQFIPPLDSENKMIVEKMHTSNAVSMHIRRGDYVSNPQYANILGNICGPEYYSKALTELDKTEEDLELFVFSDDIQWVKEHLTCLKDRKVTYIDHNKGLDSYKDMQLMSLCKHNIIANSTFSWWGAWLNGNIDKKVIAPQVWFNDPHLANNHIVPDEWIKIGG